MKICKVFAVLFATAFAVTGFVGISPGSAATTTTIKIDARTSPIFMLDVSGEGAGDFHKAVSAPATVKRCVPGETYLMNSWLTQNGIRRAWTSLGGLGAGEYDCPPSGRMVVGQPFTGDDLHPGKAFVEYSIRLCCDGDDAPEATASRMVRIPRSH
jgi:hypothetical protein